MLVFMLVLLRLLVLLWLLMLLMLMSLSLLLQVIHRVRLWQWAWLRRQERLERWEVDRGRCHRAGGLLVHLRNEAVCFAEASVDGEIDG
jgi:hypothetical protein